MKESKNIKYKNSGFIFSGCMFIGLGLGFYFGEVAIGVLIGMGVGFIAMDLMNSKNVTE